MNSNGKRVYASPLREAQAQQTREQILQSVGDWMQSQEGGAFTLEAIAKIAGVQVRTVLRHFQSKEELLKAFWNWINQRIAPDMLPSSLAELVESPRQIFPKFDEVEGIVRGSLHSDAGKDMRHAALSSRREVVDQAVDQIPGPLNGQDSRRIKALLHLLLSASAWETMRDYADLTGEEAGDAAAWALRLLTQSFSQSAYQGNQTMTIQVTQPQTAPSLWVVRDQVRFMGEVPGGNLAVIEADVPAGSGTPPHVHQSPEIFRVLSGEITFGLFGEGGPQMITATAGSVVTVPSMVPHNYQNLSGEPASMMVVLEKPMVEFFQELGRSEPLEGPPSEEEIEEIMAACAKHGIRVLQGPPPAA